MANISPEKNAIVSLITRGTEVTSGGINPNQVKVLDKNETPLFFRGVVEFNTVPELGPQVVAVFGERASKEPAKAPRANTVDWALLLREPIDEENIDAFALGSARSVDPSNARALELLSPTTDPSVLASTDQSAVFIPLA